jgi:glycosyl transferase family 25
MPYVSCMDAAPPFYVINLAGARDRWRRMVAMGDAIGLGERLKRAEAVDGRHISESEWRDFDAQGFARRNGRTCLPGEYGCYRSHLEIFRIMAAAGDAVAIVLEDDASVAPDALARIDRIAALLAGSWSDRPAMVKLVNHRVSGFRPQIALGPGLVLGRTVHGPCGSSAAYVINRLGARRLAAAAVPMRVPYDMILEAGWETGLHCYTVAEPIVTLDATAAQSGIASRAEYRRRKFPAWRRLPCYLRRARDYVRRALYALARPPR